MKYALLDTNFILSCVRKKIDFFEEVQSLGLSVIIPKQVIEELRGISNSKPEAKIALKILEKNEFKKITLHGKNVDKGIIKTARENEGWIIATLDREMKSRIKNQKMTIRGEKRLEIVK
ncbi:MAG: PIN domain-containing protein [Candidatus Nanoarchaeia archaeon]|nr:PIN domain-containing protein [Candidatus Nanoarchaeia archaeon]MDD5357779.1 PIN domain-containing protein [Candidatus Nanoarchaeia archaeon]MDD5588698.1 PIN domain-containing protein [Candidatus Nanoarchaeia archaeon]